MEFKKIFSDAELHTIVDEAAIYMCACPGQVANEIRGLRNLILYQQSCTISGKTPESVHLTIEASAIQAHALMEDCLEHVLSVEGWDRKTLKMPAGLRRLRDDFLNESE